MGLESEGKYLQDIVLTTTALASGTERLLSGQLTSSIKEQLVVAFSAQEVLGGVARSILNGQATEALDLERLMLMLKPPGFAGLLRQEIITVFPLNPPQPYTQGEIEGFLDQDLTADLIKRAGFNGHKGDFTGEEAVSIVQTSLTTPPPRFRPKEAYSSGDLCEIFRVDERQLHWWSKAAGHDWNANPTVDPDAALSVWGLKEFERVWAETAEA